jgi:hypothetical protein
VNQRTLPAAAVQNAFQNSFVGLSHKILISLFTRLDLGMLTKMIVITSTTKRAMPRLLSLAPQQVAIEKVPAWETRRWVAK